MTNNRNGGIVVKKCVDGSYMDMISVESKNVANVGYIEETQLMAIEFIRGPVYVYKDVPKSVFEGMLSPETADEYFDKNVKNGFVNKRVC